MKKLTAEEVIHGFWNIVFYFVAGLIYLLWAIMIGFMISVIIVGIKFI